MGVGNPSVSDRTICYGCIATSAVLAFVCLLAAGSISHLIRGYVIAYRPDLALPVSTAFIFAHSRTIWYAAYAVALLILIGGVASVRYAPNFDQAMRRTLL